MPASESTIFSPIPFQGLGLVSPDPFPHERVGSGHKTRLRLVGVLSSIHVNTEHNSHFYVRSSVLVGTRSVGLSCRQTCIVAVCVRGKGGRGEKLKTDKE